MRADDGDSGGGYGEKSTTFRWLDAVRYTVAAVVTALIVTVIVVSIQVVLRPESLRLTVIGGSVSSTPLPAAADTPAAVALVVQLRAENPRGRARMYFLNITAYLFDDQTPASTAAPENDCIIYINHVDVIVAQQMGVVSAWSAIAIANANDPAVMKPGYFDMLYAQRRRAIGDVTMRVEGSLFTEVRSGMMMNRTASNNQQQATTYYVLLAARHRREPGRRGLQEPAGRALHSG